MAIPNRIKSTYFLFSYLVLMTGCDVGENSSNDAVSDDGIKTPLILDVPAETTGSWYQPPVLTTWQWQLEGEINIGYDVELYDVDLADTSMAIIKQLQSSNHKVICYFSAGSYENWRDDASRFKSSDYGRNLDGWEGERWLDIRSSNVHNIMTDRLDLAVSKGCNGVEPDNMDGYANISGFSLTADDQLAFNRFLANEAHQRGLSIGLKNDLDQVKQLVEYFDFAVNEQCFEYNECNLLMPFLSENKAVFNAEYADIYVKNTVTRKSLCVNAINLQLSSLIMPIRLDDSFRLTCL